MLASKSGMGKSTVTSSKLSGSGLAPKAQKDSFFVFCYKKMIALFSSIWGKTRKTLWIASTGTHYPYV